MVLQCNKLHHLKTMELLEHSKWCLLLTLCGPFWSSCSGCGIGKTEPSWITGWYPGLKSCSRSRITGSATLAVMFYTCASEALQEGVCARFWLRCDRLPLPNLCVFTIENYMGWLYSCCSLTAGVIKCQLVLSLFSTGQPSCSDSMYNTVGISTASMLQLFTIHSSLTWLENLFGGIITWASEVPSHLHLSLTIEQNVYWTTFMHKLLALLWCVSLWN